MSIQPRVSLLRWLDDCAFGYIGYQILVDGVIDGERREFWIGIDEATAQGRRLQFGDSLKGKCELATPSEFVEFSEVAILRVLARVARIGCKAPPWHGVPPPLTTYEERGCRRLTLRAYDDKCQSCIWGAVMLAEMILDRRKPLHRKYRDETYCHGPPTCHLYHRGRSRRVTGKKGKI
ncbi:MAG: hypothetical protein HY815_10055 [Candidatus Riflebacteria bacterium]|nr:hypothetical protein [Candidatus Riflebacteria bacterium]